MLRKLVMVRRLITSFVILLHSMGIHSVGVLSMRVHSKCVHNVDVHIVSKVLNVNGILMYR